MPSARRTRKRDAAPKRRRFPHISPLAWQHPADLEALAALRKVPALDQALRFVSEHLYEKAFLVESVGSRIRLGPKQAPRIWNLFREAADILDMPKVPQLFLGSSSVINAYAFGMKEYTITIHSSLVDLLTEEELMSVLGHELSHIKCQHMLYRSLAIILAQFSVNFFGLSALAVLPLQLALLAWSRKGELTCDRAALLVVQDADVVASALAKLAGMSRSMMDELDMEEVYKQAEEYEKDFDEKLLTRALKNLSAAQSTHPVPVWRAKQIRDWSRSAQYKDILAGRYLTVAEAAKGARKAGEAPVSAGRCASCGAEMEAVFSFCTQCGAEAGGNRVPCASCGKKVEAGWKKCPHCGGPTT
ncbi:MAG TPA: M48 family metallopeptidase [bacterium]|nr:M48 family metallopeptidase [bacterium]